MDYFLSEEQQMIVDVARQITDEKIIPQRVELDEKEQFPSEILQEVAQADLEIFDDIPTETNESAPVTEAEPEASDNSEAPVEEMEAAGGDA